MPVGMSEVRADTFYIEYIIEKKGLDRTHENDSCHQFRQFLH